MIQILLVIISLIIVQLDDPPEIIKAYKNNHQLILIFSSGNRSSDYEKAILELGKDPLGLDQRDLIIFEIFPSGGILPDGLPLLEKDAAALRLFYEIDVTEFTMVVLNKNQQEIFRTNQPIAVKHIFESID